jgi:hypothetical protein
MSKPHSDFVRMLKASYPTTKMTEESVSEITAILATEIDVRHLDRLRRRLVLSEKFFPAVKVVLDAYREMFPRDRNHDLRRYGGGEARESRATRSRPCPECGRSSSYEVVTTRYADGTLAHFVPCFQDGYAEVCHIDRTGRCRGCDTSPTSTYEPSVRDRD